MELLESSIRECQDEVKNTEEVVEIQLDVLRNRLVGKKAYLICF
jgi:hypothetical protein